MDEIEIKRRAKARAAQLPTSIPRTSDEEIATLVRFVTEVNNLVPAEYWDADGVLEELDFLCGLARQIWPSEVIEQCPTCGHLLLNSRNVSCSVECAKAFKAFCRDERARERDEAQLERALNPLQSAAC